MKTYIIQGDPTPWMRPGQTKTGLRFDSQKNHKLMVGIQLSSQHDGEPLRGAIHIEIYFYFHRPNTVKRRMHTTKPDLDNCIKLILDICNGIVFLDDRQITSLVAKKVYDKDPRTEITVREL